VTVAAKTLGENRKAKKKSNVTKNFDRRKFLKTRPVRIIYFTWSF